MGENGSGVGMRGRKAAVAADDAMELDDLEADHTPEGLLAHILVLAEAKSEDAPSRRNGDPKLVFQPVLLRNCMICHKWYFYGFSYRSK